MKRLLLALALAIIIAVTIWAVTYRFGSGLVVLSFADYSLETSFIFAVIFLTLCFFVFYYAIRALSFLVRMPTRPTSWPVMLSDYSNSSRLENI